VIMDILPMITSGTARLSRAIGKSFSTLLKVIMDGQQNKADYMIADMLHRSEYRNYSFHEVLAMVKGRNLEDV